MFRKFRITSHGVSHCYVNLGFLIQGSEANDTSAARSNKSSAMSTRPGNAARHLVEEKLCQSLVSKYVHDMYM